MTIKERDISFFGLKKSGWEVLPPGSSRIMQTGEFVMRNGGSHIRPYRTVTVVNEDTLRETFHGPETEFGRSFRSNEYIGEEINSHRLKGEGKEIIWTPTPFASPEA
jgi:hypothetical protein